MWSSRIYAYQICARNSITANHITEEASTPFGVESDQNTHRVLSRDGKRSRSIKLRSSRHGLRTLFMQCNYVLETLREGMLLKHVLARSLAPVPCHYFIK